MNAPQKIIRKNLEAVKIKPNELFTWQDSLPLLSGLPEGAGLNMAYEAVDRHALGPKAQKTAIRFLRANGATADWTYEDLFHQTSRFAHALARLGLQKEDTVFGLLGRLPELYVSLLATLKSGHVYCPLFSAFGPEPIETRMSLGNAAVLITTAALYRKKIAGIRKNLPALKKIILVRDGPGEPITAMSDVVGWNDFIENTDSHFKIPPTDPEEPALLHFTSGTTGKPKGVIHVHDAVINHVMTGKIALDFHEDDIFWCTADPGWVTGTSYGVIAPLVCGLTMVVDEMDYDGERWLDILEKQKVSVWYTAPTAIRMMMKAGTEWIKKRDLSSLRFIASVGEPLNPEAVTWGLDAFGLPIHDNWWQTETGGIMIANLASMDIKPGSMGKPLPGIQAAIVARQEDGTLKILKPGETGELALKKGWPSMFRGYLHGQERYRKCFVGEWYLTGDLAQVDEESYFWFVGRADDMIKSAGHLVGPFEVESALMEHPAVGEAGVIGKPDPVVHEVIKAFVSLKGGFASTDGLKKDLLGFARKRLGASIAPKEIEILSDLPKTRSGKIMRRLLKAHELGLPEGDVSTLEVKREPDIPANH